MDSNQLTSQALKEQEGVAIMSLCPDGSIIMRPEAVAAIFPHLSQRTIAQPFNDTPATVPSPENDIYAINIARSLEYGAEIHEKLQERLKAGEERYPAFSAIASEMNKPTTAVQVLHRNYLSHQKKEKQQHFRAVILAGKKFRKTDKMIAAELGCNEKTVAKKRRELERELLEGAV